MPTPPVAGTPNILLLFCDQLRFDALRCAGDIVPCTPNLDRLAAEGVRFDRAYTPVPVCIAARHSLLYGHRCATHGRFANNVPTVEPLLYSLPQLLSYAGYHTRAVGKMHWRPVRRHHGFDRMELMEEIPDYREDDEFLLHLKAHGYGHVRAVHGIRHLLYQMPQHSALPAELHGSSWVGERTVEFLQQNRDRPFFCWSSWIAPHPPWNAPEPYASQYRGVALPEPIGRDRDIATLPPDIHWLREIGAMNRVGPPAWRRVRELYAAQVTLIDHAVGRILHTVDELGLRDNTLVIFTSDHGEMLGDQGSWQKSQPFDPSARIPFLMRLPGRTEPGKVADELISLLDIVPTCLGLAGVDYPGDTPLPGADLLGAEGGGTAARRKELVIEHGRPPNRWLSLLREGLKYTIWLRTGWEELYDLRDDPHELTNLLLGADTATRNMADEMWRRLVAWERGHGFSESIDGDTFIAPPEPNPAPRRGGAVNLQFPRWLARLDPRERALMNTLGEEMAQVTDGEDSFSLDDLDLEQWVERGGEECARALAYLRSR